VYARNETHIGLEHEAIEERALPPMMTQCILRARESVMWTSGRGGRSGQGEHRGDADLLGGGGGGGGGGEDAAVQHGRGSQKSGRQKKSALFIIISSISWKLSLEPRAPLVH